VRGESKEEGNGEEKREGKYDRKRERYHAHTEQLGDKIR
jgi:hypothetical protein